MKPAIALQYALPHRLLSRLVYWATRWTWKPWKNFLIGQIVRRFNVDLSEAQTPDLAAFEHFNAFFTRLLKPGARSADPAADALLCPADGKVSQAGPIRAGRILQAKGQDYTVAELLASEADAAVYADGSFVTVYLSPRDYHRAHMPLSGTLVSTVHVPGRLFSVAPAPVAAIPRLFARNERLVCHFEGEHGPFVVVMVGAMLVSSVSTVWSGLEIPPYASRVTRREWRDQNIRLERFAEMARFNMGSTVIVLLPPGVGQIAAELAAEQAVKVGQRIGTLRGA
ncbi:archaetidylserine decarboxylase [Tahibacter harae]|uniref:Phosphatidylserine decarboxylase proenzyme n=1 Tax=Tahibacter harae TaxID=2963937 RepID=A0ABT1QXX0_9GAMM|nr:archaetidylserine decarboxylase [Tahibacter harae]MCQ4167140.1 archaetidylserine decarboxylase [Tahibacter harae]